MILDYKKKKIKQPKGLRRTGLIRLMVRFSLNLIISPLTLNLADLLMILTNASSTISYFTIHDRFAFKIVEFFQLFITDGKLVKLEELLNFKKIHLCSSLTNFQLSSENLMSEKQKLLLALVQRYLSSGR